MDRSNHIAVFRGAASGVLPASDRLLLPEWSDADWNRLLGRTRPRPFRASEVVIQRGAADRDLFFVVAGTLEVGVTHVDGVSITPLAKINAGSVVGEQSFFDGQVRSVNVWGVTDGELLPIEFDEFSRFGREEPALARVLSARLRNTTFRVRR